MWSRVPFRMRTPVVLVLVVQVWFDGPWCGAPVMQCVIVCCARSRPNARCAGVIVCGRGAVMPGAGQRHAPAAQPAVPADRCAPEILAILAICAALAAAERQPVGRQLSSSTLEAMPFVSPQQADPHSSHTPMSPSRGDHHRYPCYNGRCIHLFGASST